MKASACSTRHRLENFVKPILFDHLAAFSRRSTTGARIGVTAFVLSAGLMLAGCNDAAGTAETAPSDAPVTAVSDTPAEAPSTKVAQAEPASEDTGSAAAQSPANESATPEAEPAAPAAAPVDAPESTGEVDMDVLLQPGPLEEKVLGEADAPVTVVEYMSMTCPHCASFHEETFPELKAQYVDSGKVRFIFREFPFDPRSAAAFMLTRCASDEQYLPMVDVLFKQQRAWATAEDGRAALEKIAKLAGFTQESFETCLTDQKLLDDVNAVRNRAAEEFDVDSTPTFFINGRKYSGALSLGQMSAIIDPLL